MAEFISADGMDNFIRCNWNGQMTHFYEFIAVIKVYLFSFRGNGEWGNIRISDLSIGAHLYGAHQPVCVVLGQPASANEARWGWQSVDIDFLICKAILWRLLWLCARDTRNTIRMEMNRFFSDYFRTMNHSAMSNGVLFMATYSAATVLVIGPSRLFQW